MGGLLASTPHQSGIAFESISAGVNCAVRLIYRRAGLFGAFALWWYMELLPEKQLCENSDAFFRAVPRDFRTGDPTLDSDTVTCEGA
eukprot:COSAG02_NODE_3959_length_5983_cov_9.304176_6_plen_87_part_00